MCLSFFVAHILALSLPLSLSLSRALSPSLSLSLSLSRLLLNVLQGGKIDTPPPYHAVYIPQMIPVIIGTFAKTNLQFIVQVTFYKYAQ